MNEILLANAAEQGSGLRQLGTTPLNPTGRPKEVEPDPSEQMRQMSAMLEEAKRVIQQLQADKAQTLVDQEQTTTKELQELVRSQSEQIAKLATGIKPVAEPEKVVRVRQWRVATIGGEIIKKDVQVQTYSQSEFDKLSGPHPADPDKTQFGVLGLYYEVLDDEEQA